MTHALLEPHHADCGIATVFANPGLGGRRMNVADNSTVFEPHTSPDELYFIESGQVRLYQLGPDGSMRLSEILGPGDWFGIAALARAGTYGTRAVTVTTSVLWTLAAEQLFDLLRQEPDVAVELIGQLADRLETANEDAARLMFDDCNQRLINTLVRFSRTAAATPLGDGGVVLRITHQQLAQAVGAARETISLALTQLRQRNLLRTGRNRLFFKPEALQQFCTRPMPDGDLQRVN
jgi:CRP/FNR family transcriptional regulator